MRALLLQAFQPTIAMIAYDLVRMPKLLGATA